MFQPLLQEKFKYFIKFFESALTNEKRKIPQSIVLYGQDCLAQYYIAQDIARILNCKKEKEAQCTCINCNWIRENRHPEVLTYSRFDNRGSKESANKNIAVNQICELRNKLVCSSEYYRVFIICDTDNHELTKYEKAHLQNFASLNFRLPSESEAKEWYPRPLNREVLPAATSNALLKSIEEPPENVLFIFLTDDKDSLLETIVSRSQSFYIPSFLGENYDTKFLEPILGDYPQIKKVDVLNLVQSFLSAKDDAGYGFEYAVDCMQFYFKEMMKSNLENKTLVNKLKKDILSLQTVKRQLNSYIKPQQIIESFMFSIAK